MTPLDEAREAVDETDLDDSVVTDWCVCRAVDCLCEERRNDRLQPWQCVAFVWSLRASRWVGEG
jgi:hypothetical protein